MKFKKKFLESLPVDEGAGPYEFTAHGNPIPKERPRLGRGGHVYTPSNTLVWEWTVRAAYQGPLYGDELMVELTFYRSDNQACDLDNLVKSVLDALNTKAWKDDSQIVELRARKNYDPDRAGVWMRIVPLPLPFTQKGN